MATYIAIFVVIIAGLFGISKTQNRQSPETSPSPVILPEHVQATSTHTETPIIPQTQTPAATSKPATIKPKTTAPTQSPSASQNQTAPATTPTATANTQATTQTQTTVTPTPTPTPAPEQTPTPAAVSVHIRNFAFDPATISVRRGTTVTWTNFDTAGHTVTGESGGPSSGIIGNGQTYSYTFNTAGTFPYFCSPHPGMRGTVTVIN